MRLIDADALYMELSQEAAHRISQSDGSRFDTGGTNGIICARDSIKSAPTIDPGRWIPVSERLPEQDGSYLVIDESENMFNSTFDGSCGDNGEFGEWNAIYDQHTLGYLDSEWNSYSGITHWRSLPEPPQKG